MDSCASGAETCQPSGAWDAGIVRGKGEVESVLGSSSTGISRGIVGGRG